MYNERKDGPRCSRCSSGPRKEAQPGSKFGCDFKMELIMLACCLLRDEIAHSYLQLFGNSGFCYVPQGPLLILNLGRTPLVWAALILYGRSIGTDGEGSIPRRLPRIYRKALLIFLERKPILLYTFHWKGLSLQVEILSIYK